jgi:hypothetical protein
MGGSSRKLNFLIEQGVCRDLELLVPSGKRSKFVNEALRKELGLILRRKAVETLLASPLIQSTYSNREIVERLARDRGAH